MKTNNHWAVFLSNNANKQSFIQELLEGKAPGKLSEFNTCKGELFSDHLIADIIEEEYRHERIEVEKEKNRSFRSLSGGEQRKSLLNYCLSKKPEYLILDNPFDNLDLASQKSFRTLLGEIADQTAIIQLINRKSDKLDLISNVISIDDDNTIIYHENSETYFSEKNTRPAFNGSVPPPLFNYKAENKNLVSFNSVSVSYDNKTILKDICWEINAGEFWQLIGPNGSGKTTLLSLIIGDNPQGYGQNLILFGRKKGSGESIWDIKDKVGYFTPSMTDLFSKYFSLEHMIISGFLDSIGLYIQPSDLQIKLANEWLRLINMHHLKHTTFGQLSLGQQRMALIARAMVKHPPLLILDEPASGMDDANALLVTTLINKIAAESKTTILYVSHRKEEGLKPRLIFELTPSSSGSIGTTHKIS
ncbi:MAG: ATP-binding cassette domain-containing protein [Bacteroidota bacterium]